ncbi:MAG TPA: M56 family metallopeptidase [Candidatus Acidoferrum sp.]|jgi:beta-lactamase regulating signal transducer with metallopeptidase domain|nr:M56 family metallopeptidase [Candidatus Acidoferrum sp.]
MMFALRGIAVSFSIFVLLYCTLSLVVCGVWGKVFAYGQRSSARPCADLLFALRMAPFVIAGGVTLTLAVPSFLLLEPHAANEPLGVVPVILGLCGLAVMLAGVWKAATALLQASRTVAQWSRTADTIASGRSDCGTPVAVQRVSSAALPLTAAGIFRPSVWLSRAAEFVLSERELESALRHEMAHVRRRDNLRKLILRLVVFPGMAELETVWREATEMAADDGAVSSASEALDLAAAVIKLSRLALLEAPTELTTALVHSPASSLNARVERLIAWTEPRENAAPRYSLPYLLCAVATVVATLVVTYGELLVRVHTATEWLVR